MATEVSRRQVLTGGAALLGLAAAGGGGAYAASRAGSDGDSPSDATLPPLATARGGNGMNVVLIVLESTRKDHLGVYGSSVQTPNLDALARSGTRFTRAYPEMMPTIPIRRALHTGLRTYPAKDWQEYRDSAPLPGWEPIPQEQTTLAEMLGQVDYSSAFVNGNPEVLRASMDFQRGFASWDWVRGQYDDAYRPAKAVSDADLKRYLFPNQFGKREERVMRQFLANHRALTREEDWPAAQTFTAAANSLKTLKEQQPFMLVVDDFEPHEPFIAPDEFIARYSDGFSGKIDPVLPNYGPADYLDHEQLIRMRALYAAEVTYLDHWVGRLLDELEAQKLTDSTLVIAIADHGLMLGEHNLTGKPTGANYPELVDIPLLIRHPERSGGDTSDVLASTHDITPTILGNLDVTVEGELDGVDLLSDAAGDRKHATSMYNTALWVREGDWWLIGKEYGEDNLLFNLSEDPGLEKNVASREPDVVRRMLDLAEKDAGGEIPHYKT